MKRIWKRLLVLLVIFLVAASAFVLYIRFSSETPEEEVPDYQVWDSAALPVISAQVDGQRVNILHGYTSDVDSNILEDTVMPVGEDGKLTLTVTCYDTTLESVSWEITTRDGSETVAKKQAKDLTQNHDTAEFTLDLSSVLTVDQDYRLKILLVLSDGTGVSYYTRVRMGENLRADKLLGYVLGFHNSSFDKTAMLDYAANLENDGTADTGTLADVTIHSSFDQITWGDLAPEEVGELSLSIQEIDGNFGSFLLEYQVQSEDESGDTDTYLVTEYLSVQWTSTRFYLMDYHRTMTELFEAGTERFRDGTIDFGIQAESDVALTSSEDGNILTFTVAGELWSYDESEQELIQVFTFRDEDDGVRSGYRRYGIKVLDTDDGGDIVFLVYGYMNRGKHEGNLGISCLQYLAEENNIQEIFFIPCSGTSETLKKEVETLSCMGEDGEIYLLLQDSLYSIDWANDEVTVLADHVSRKSLVVNDRQTAVAWDLGTDQSGLQILYLDDGSSQFMEVDSGDWIAPQGFVDEDCILAMGHREDSAVWGALQVNPYYAVVILERSGSEVVRYEYENIYIASVTVSGGQIVLDRLKKGEDGEFTAIESDALIESTPEEDDDAPALTSRTDDVKARVWQLKPGTDMKKVRSSTPDLISYASADKLNFPEPEEDESLRYYGFGEGKLMSVAPDAGTAIAAVYDAMGCVIDSDGNLIWYRTSRKGSEQLSVSAQGSVDAAEALKNCLEQIIRIGNLSASALDSLDMSLSSEELMEELFPGQTVNLSGCPVKALLYYIDRDRPVLIQDRQGNTMLLVGYDQFNVVYYDPTRGTTYRQGQEDAADTLETGEYSFLSYLPAS